jgi:hypothetical protein
MQLSYRGASYNASTQDLANSSASQNASQSKVRLMYRGQTYDHVPQANLAQKLTTTDAQTVTLFYQGQPYQRQLLTTKPAPKPHAINWRWQFNSQA